MKLSLAENRMYTCPGYEESTCGVREEKRAEKKMAQCRNRQKQTIMPHPPSIKSI